MSQENVDLVRRLMDAFDRGDLGTRCWPGTGPCRQWSGMGRADTRVGRVKRSSVPGTRRTCASGSRSWRRFSPTAALSSRTIRDLGDRLVAVERRSAHVAR